MSPDDLIKLEPKDLDEARELIDRFVVVLGAQQRQIDELRAQLDELVERAGRSSSNSHNPPSSDSCVFRRR